MLESNINEVETNKNDERAYASISVNPTSINFSTAAQKKNITVSCADSGWIVSAGSPSWCTISKQSNTSAVISVTQNTGAKRSTGCTCVNGSKAATVFVTQEGATVTYNRQSMITLYKFYYSDSCAYTCAAMCVNQSPQTIYEDGIVNGIPTITPGYAQWTKIGNMYNYTVSSDPPAVGTLQDVYNELKAGYPVITKINDTTNGQHWVVVVKYTGTGSNLIDSDFTCADPQTGQIVALDKATNYDGIYKYATYKKN